MPSIRTRLMFHRGNSEPQSLDTRIDTGEAVTTDATILALKDYNTNGLFTQTAANTFTGRTLTAGSAKISIANGDGVAGNPSVNLGSVASTDLSDGANLYKSGGTDVAVADGGTGASTASGARSNLGLVLGTNVVAIGGALALNIRTINATGAPAADDYTLLVDASGGAVTVNLPAAASSTGRILVVKKIDAVANAVTLDGNGAETIDGAATQATSTQWAGFTVQCNGTGWFIL